MSEEASRQIGRVNRRAFLETGIYGLGAAALASLMSSSPLSASSTRWPGVIRPPHRPPKCKRVIHLYMAGGPSHLETLDHKPALAKLSGTPMPTSFTAGQQLAQLQGHPLKCLGPQYEFKRFGGSGLELSTAFPRIATLADKMCVIKSMHTDQINHDTAHTVMNTGTSLSGRPSMGSWVNYGLGSESDELPGYVVMSSVGGGQNQPIAARQWHSGFLPSRFQGVFFQAHGDPVLYVNNPDGVTDEQQGRLVDAVGKLNRIGDESFRDPEIDARVSQYEMAFRMQASVPGLMDISDEPQSVLDMYGIEGGGGEGTFASNCLLARRLAERGVRFIQLYHRGWDHHGGVRKGIEVVSGHVDRATAALVCDLERRGMLEDTLILWGGEFGRTPMSQGGGTTNLGRDHHIKAFSMWMAGGGVKPGMTYGATDELGYDVVENPVHVRDLHATILHLLGIDTRRFSVKFQGLDQRLTGVEPARVLTDCLA